MSILFLFLSGCATTTGYQQRMQTWIGASDIKLIREIGAPDSTYTSGSSKFLEYVYSRTTSIDYTTNYYSNSSHTYSTGGITYSCKTTYEVISGIITNVQWSGNNCKAKPLE